MRRHELAQLVAREAAGSSPAEGRLLVDRASRLWLQLDRCSSDVIGQFDRWLDRYPGVDSVWYAAIVERLAAGDREGGARLLATWSGSASAPFATPRWWASRLVEAAAGGSLAVPMRGGAVAQSSLWPGEPNQSWLRDVIRSLRAAAAPSTAQVVVLRSGTEPEGLASDLIVAAEAWGLRGLSCPLDGTGSSHPLGGWLGTLWGDVHWRLRGDQRLARLAPVVDHHLGWDRPHPRVSARATPPVDTRRSDAVLVEVAHRLTCASPDALVVAVTGSPAALGWFDRFVLRVHSRRPASEVVRFVDVRLGGPGDRG